MARIFELTAEQRKQWDEWLASRPEKVRKAIGDLNPWTLYKISTGHRVTLYSFAEHEDGSVTCTVLINGTYNLVTHNRRVFGVNPAELVECDLPAPGEKVGTLLTDNESIKRLIALTEPIIQAIKAAPNN